MYKKINIDSALNKIVRNDNLFYGDYTIDPYQNCEFGCKYCDSSFENTIYIKENICDLLEKEIKKIPKNSNIIIGSVHDPYQKIEKKENKTKKILKIILKNKQNCHILTKSDLILRDMDILKKISKCYVTISIISLNPEINNIFEKNVISSKKRLKLVRFLNDNEIFSGISLMPYIPFIVDNEIEDIIKEAKFFNAKYFLYKTLELKGDQKKKFLEVIKKNYSIFLKDYKKLYDNSYMPKKSYQKKIDKKFLKLIRENKLKEKIK